MAQYRGSGRLIQNTRLKGTEDLSRIPDLNKSQAAFVLDPNPYDNSLEPSLQSSYAGNKWVIATVTLLVATLITTHEPPSRFCPNP